jgi:hypothetical protein
MLDFEKHDGMNREIRIPILAIFCGCLCILPFLSRGGVSSLGAT